MYVFLVEIYFIPWHHVGMFNIIVILQVAQQCTSFCQENPLGVQNCHVIHMNASFRYSYLQVGVFVH